MRGCAGKTTGSSSRESPAAIRRSRSGRDVGFAVNGGDDVAPGVVRRRDALAGDRREAERRVGHYVPHDERLPGDALRGKRLDRPLVGAEQERRKPVDLDPRALLRHREVAAPQPCLDVGDRNALRARGAGARERRVGVAQHEHDGGPLCRHDGADRRRQRVDVRGAEVEPVGGLRQAELVEEDLRELVVPVLPRVDDHLVDPRRAQRLGERRRLDELRPVADDGEDLHEGGGSWGTMGSPTSTAAAGCRRR